MSRPRSKTRMGKHLPPAKMVTNIYIYKFSTVHNLPTITQSAVMTSFSVFAKVYRSWSRPKTITLKNESSDMINDIKVKIQDTDRIPATFDPCCKVDSVSGWLHTFGL